MTNNKIEGLNQTAIGSGFIVATYSEKPGLLITTGDILDADAEKRRPGCLEVHWFPSCVPDDELDRLVKGLSLR